MANDTFINAVTEPKGKRTVRSNIYGNLVGYIGRTRWEDFGIDDMSNNRRADAWVNGDENWMNA